MNYIYQGQNDPLSFEVTEEIQNADKISAVLFQYGDSVKEWTKDDIEMDGAYIWLPLSEGDTLKLHRGKAELSIKALTEKDRVIIAEKVKYKVVETLNKTRMVGDNP